MIQIAASACSPIVRVLFSEDPQQKVALFARFEGTGEDDVAPRVQIKPLQDFTGVGKGTGGTCTVVVVNPMFREYITAIIWGLGKENGMGECGMGECGMGEYGMGEYGMESKIIWNETRGMRIKRSHRIREF